MRKEKAFERVRAMARERGGECVSKTFVDSQTPLRWRCAQGHTWRTVPAVIRQGSWCPECAAPKKLGLATMRALAKERGGDCISTEYVDVNTPLRWRCAEGHEWTTIAQKIRYRRTWCPVCARRSTKTVDDLHALAAEHEGVCLSTRVTTIHDTSYRWRCKAGHVFQTSAHQVQQGHWCPKCRGRGPRGTLARMRRIAQRRGGECISKEYKNAFGKLAFRCREGHEWRTTPGALVQGSWCPACGIETPRQTTRLTIEDMHATAAAKGGRCLSELYRNNRDRLRWQCALGHVWKALVGNVRARSWCPTCAQRFPGTIDGMRALAAAHDGRCLSTEYTSHKSMVSFECKSGHRFRLRGVAAKSGVWCPECSRR